MTNAASQIIRALSDALRAESKQTASDYVDACEEIGRLRVENKRLRGLLFIGHSHGPDGTGLYGDDGERQCSTRVTDFNRMTPDQIGECIMRYNLKHHGEEAKRVINAKGE